MPSPRAQDVPDVFICPISLEIMSDPVIAADGHAYDRACITRWYKTGAQTSPLTRETLHTADVFTAHPLRTLMTDHPVARQHLRKPAPQTLHFAPSKPALSPDEREARSLRMLLAATFTFVGLGTAFLYASKVFAVHPALTFSLIPVSWYD